MFCFITYHKNGIFPVEKYKKRNEIIFSAVILQFLYICEQKTKIGKESMKSDIKTDAAERDAFRISRKRTWIELVILIASGACMALSFAPADISFFAWCSVVPLIWICAGRTWKRSFLYGLIWGYAWHFGGTFFLREINGCIPFIFALVLGLFNAVFAATIPFFFKNLLYPSEIRSSDFRTRETFWEYPVIGEICATFALSSLWILLEWLRSWIFTGFPWNLLGVSQWQNIMLIQICEYTGVFGVSFVVILINIALYFAIHGFRHSLPQGKYKRPYPLIVAIVILITSHSFGTSLYNNAVATYKTDYSEIAVGVVQPHLSQRREGTGRQSSEALQACKILTDKLLSADRQRRLMHENHGTANLENIDSSEAKKMLKELDLVVWPESAVPRCYYEMYDYEMYVREAKHKGDKSRLAALEAKKPFGAIYRETVRGILKDLNGKPLILGTLTFNKEPGKGMHNSALMLKDGKPEHKKDHFYDQADVYSKVHIVPFGEFIPLAWKFPVLDKWLGLGRSLAPGKAFHPLTVKEGIRAGALICYEDVFAYTARGQAQNGANFLLVITNDAWYPKSSEPEQHYINSIFRTVETRLPMVRCGNSDYSVLISHCGETVDAVVKRYDNEGNVILNPGIKKSESGVFLVRVQNQPQQTFYTRYGNVFVLLCGLIFLLAGGTAVFQAYLTWRNENDPLRSELERVRNEFLNSKEPGKK